MEAPRKRRRKRKKSSPSFFLDYYQRPFYLFLDEIKRQGYKPELPHPIRRRFWGLLPEREYNPFEARTLGA